LPSNVANPRGNRDHSWIGKRLITIPSTVVE
jgi:hypothetical protein